jgi:hypothetical protein
MYEEKKKIKKIQKPFWEIKMVFLWKYKIISGIM